MAKGINKVTLLGNLGKAPEIRSAAGGLTIAQFSIATAERTKQGDQWVDATEWHHCTAFGKLAEILQRYTTKGSKVHVEGRLKADSWTDKNTGEKKYRTGIIVSDVVLLDSRKSDAAPDDRPSDPEAQYHTDYATPAVTDEDVPF